MQIVVLASPETEVEFRQKFSASIPYTVVHTYQSLVPYLDKANVIFDFYLADQPAQLAFYAHKPGLTVFCQAAKIQLAALASSFLPLACRLFGFNGLPGFLNRPILEVSLFNSTDIPFLPTVCNFLQTDYRVVADRVGMVTPRIMVAIINEACFTLQEKTAQIEDIDLSMKLGANYPFGPFEWANRLGLQYVYELLDALYNDTKDARYKICPFLKTKYLRGESF